ncbi:MAG: hypothetical protein COW67_09250 [Flavobacteriales bacterium CG18_big_fil_WC_8_21_14_2_50_32_9]|nr:MAG: hypothetical protein COW67_09250 [Flavobacteriales bacterium CG18_big_fil_WC_8_21_14_2_50_32_9]
MKIYINGKSLQITNLEEGLKQADSFRNYSEDGKNEIVIYWNQVFVELLKLKLKQVNENEKMQIFKTLWLEFGDISVNNEDELEVRFLVFEKGTNKLEIWHWFDVLFNVVLSELI